MKQMIKNSALFLAMTAAIVFQSCKKNKDDSNTANTKLLTTGSWKLKAYTINPALNPNGETNLYTSWPACRKDDLHIFKSNGTVDVDAGLTKCNAGDPQVIIWHWNFSNANETTMMYDGNEYTIEELTTATLRIRHYYFNTSTAGFHVKELIYQH